MKADILNTLRWIGVFAVFWAAAYMGLALGTILFAFGPGAVWLKALLAAFLGVLIGNLAAGLVMPPARRLKAVTAVAVVNTTLSLLVIAPILFKAHRPFAMIAIASGGVLGGVVAVLMSWRRRERVVENRDKAHDTQQVLAQYQPRSFKEPGL